MTQNSSVWLGRSAAFWYIVTAVGQIAFILFIMNHYGSRTLGGDWAAWNDRNIITGHVPGDRSGNIMFAAHVLLAAVMTATGLIQLPSALRVRWPRLHRWSGRVFVGLAVTLAVGGLWLTWVRGSYLSLPSALSVSLNGALILLFAVLAITRIRQRRIAAHRIWALRLFMAASGVWFFRIMIMAWVILNQGPRGMNETLSGPADIILSLASYLLPLLVLELYLRADRSGSSAFKAVAAIVVAVMTLLMAVGIFGAVHFMWF